MKKIFSLKKIGSMMAAHKVWSTIIIVALVGGGYWTYKKVTAAPAVPTYTIATARVGTLRQTVTGSGQISANNQLDVKSQVSGTILKINASVGQTVKAGDLIATIDPANALVDLQNARIALAKLTQPAKASEISSAENSLSKSYSDAFNAVSTMYLDLPNIMAGLKDLFYSQTGFLSDQSSNILISSSRDYRDTAAKSFDLAVIHYQASVLKYKNLTRSSATSSLDTLFADSYTTIKEISEVLKNTQNALTFISSVQPDYLASRAASAAANVTSWSSQINSDLSSIASAQSSISSNNNSLSTLTEGPDSLDLQSQQLSLQQKEKAYGDYFIRAPFDGIVGRIPVHVYDEASGGTVITTLVGEQKIATISLNEIDAAKVKVGQAVTITFDAIDTFTATGTVSEVDYVGTVTQGVVTYNVKISVDTVDTRIKPGMSVNTTIITNEKENVLLVASSAVKTVGTTHYIDVFDSLPTSATPAATANMRTFGQNAATGTGQGRFNRMRTASSTPIMASSTLMGRTVPTGENSLAAQQIAQNRNVTVSTAATPRRVIVTVGDTDDTNTEILSGLNAGQLVVTRTVAASGTAAATTPTILNSLGGNRAPTGAANRTFTR